MKDLQFDQLYIPQYMVNVHIVTFEDTHTVRKWMKQEHGINLGTNNFTAMTVKQNGSNYFLLFERPIEFANIVHESVHMRQFIFDNISFYVDGWTLTSPVMESEAYFTAWLAKEVYTRLKDDVSEDLYITKQEAIT